MSQAIDEQTYRYVPPEGVPSAVIVDIDGTVALNAHRSPYDQSQYHTDEVNEPVAALVVDLAAAGERILYVSGRDDTYRAETRAWLEAHDLWWRTMYDGDVPSWVEPELHMRPMDRETSKSHKRNDAIVKIELFREHIADRFDIRFVLDDRDRVVKAWRGIGLTVLQVAEGAF